MKKIEKMLVSLMVVILLLIAVPLISNFIELEMPALDLCIKASAISSSGKCGDNVTYTYNSTTKKLVISGTGAMAAYGDNSSPFYNSDIKSLVVEDGVTSIGNNAFYNCTRLTNIIIADSVTSIGGGAFYNCSGLKELTMPASAKLSISFNKCTNIEKITLTKGTGVMQSYTSSNSSSTTDTHYTYTPWYISDCAEIIIEDGVTSIGAVYFIIAQALKV